MLVPPRIKWCDPAGLATADASSICRCDDGCDYVIKDGSKNTYIPHCEWFCTRLAELIGIPSPPCTVIEYPDGSSAFGSRWEGGVAKEPWWEMLRRGDIALQDISGPLSRIYAFDHFVHNEDRHLNNFLFREQRQGWAVLAFDYSRAWLFSGTLLPRLPFDPDKKTILARRVLCNMFDEYIEKAETDRTLQRLADVTMAHIYKYSILAAIPDRRRGERVNVGIVVFRVGKADVRLVQAAFKLKALTRENWEARIESVRERISQLCSGPETPETLLERLAFVDPLIAPTGMGMLSAHGTDDYEKAINEILESLVILPKSKPSDSVSRINTEIAKTFRKAKALAKSEQGLKEGKIVRFLPIAPSEGLLADFALRNGRMHIASTLDLRKQSVRLDEAALKSIVLVKSRDIYGKSVRRIGVYAVEHDLKKQFSHHIELLSDYADETYNWLDQTKRNFLRTMYDAMHAHG